MENWKLTHSVNAVLHSLVQATGDQPGVKDAQTDLLHHHFSRKVSSGTPRLVLPLLHFLLFSFVALHTTVTNYYVWNQSLVGYQPLLSHTILQEGWSWFFVTILLPMPTIMLHT